MFDEDSGEDRNTFSLCPRVHPGGKAEREREPYDPRTHPHVMSLSILAASATRVLSAVGTHSLRGDGSLVLSARASAGSGTRYTCTRAWLVSTQRTLRQVGV